MSNTIIQQTFTYDLPDDYSVSRQMLMAEPQLQITMGRIKFGCS